MANPHEAATAIVAAFESMIDDRFKAHIAVANGLGEKFGEAEEDLRRDRRRAIEIIADALRRQES